jgi:fluoride exporter
MKEFLLRWGAIGAAGFIGALLRWRLTLLFGRLDIRFPLGTLFINITGSLFLGWFYAYTKSHPASDTLRLAVAVGFVGSYTTFSTYMYDCVALANDGAWKQSLFNLFGSMALGLTAVFIGIALAGGPATTPK